MDEIYSLTDIADELNISKHKVSYYLVKLGIQPTAKLGGRNGYSRQSVSLLKDMIVTLERLKNFRHQKQEVEHG